MASWEFKFYFIAFPSQKLSNEPLSSDYIQPLPSYSQNISIPTIFLWVLVQALKVESLQAKQAMTSQQDNK
jgi:hypothetical protein